MTASLSSHFHIVVWHTRFTGHDWHGGDAGLLPSQPVPRYLPQLSVHQPLPKVTHGLYQHLQVKHRQWRYKFIPIWVSKIIFQHPRTPALDNMGQLLRRQGGKVKKRLRNLTKIRIYRLLTNKLFRDAVFRVLAVEQPQAVVLNYAPGSPFLMNVICNSNNFTFRSPWHTHDWGAPCRP